jgi:hypothetical protein
VSLSIVVLVVLFNVFMNEYGLFGEAKGKSIKIYGDERTSKYLLSLNYIPSNFNGLLIGSSVSDNLDSKRIGGLRVYNASINGASIAELKILVDNVLSRADLQCVIISLHPILTERSEKRTNRMVPGEYWGSLGSIDTLDFYRKKLSVKLDKKYDYFDDYGRYDYNLRKDDRDSESIIRKKASEMKSGETISIDDRACAMLDDLLKALRARGTKIFAYYHPIPRDLFILCEESYRSYQERINAFFCPEDFVWDYNGEEYQNFTSDHANYCDEIHLSRKGIDFLIDDINTRLAQQASI